MTDEYFTRLGQIYEIYYEILNIIAMIFEGWCAQKLFRSFVDTRLKARFAKYGAGVFWAALNITMSFFIPNGTDNFTLLIKLGVYILALYLFTVLWYKGGFLQRLFPVLLFTVIRELAVQMTNGLTIIHSLFIDLLWYLSDEAQKIPPDAFPTIMYVSLSIIITLIEVLRVFSIYRAARSVVGSCRRRPALGKEAVLNLLPSAVALTVAAMIRLLLISVEDGYTILIYDRYPLLYVIIPIMTAGLLIAVVYSFKLYQDMTELRLEQADRAVLESQLLGMQNALAEKERLYDSFRAARHDMRNSLTALRGLISRKCPDDEEINRYFESISLPLEQAESRVKTGSAVCDAIISDKIAAAEKELPDIRFDTDGLFFTEDVKADQYDIGMILSNGLDNAVEACRRLREKDGSAPIFITARSFRRKKMFFIEIENSFDGVLKLDGSGSPLSLKEDGELHGIGLRNIRKCAEKYSGSMDIIVGEGSFTLSVMMKA